MRSITLLLALLISIDVLSAPLKSEIAYREANSIICRIPNTPLAIYNRDIYEGGVFAAQLCADGLLIRDFIQRRVAHVTTKLIERSDEIIAILETAKKTKDAIANESDTQKKKELEKILAITRTEFASIARTDHRYHSGYNPFKKELIIPHLMRYFFEVQSNNFLKSSLPKKVLDTNRAFQMAYEKASNDPEHKQAQENAEQLFDAINTQTSLFRKDIDECIKNRSEITAECLKFDQESAPLKSMLIKIIEIVGAPQEALDAANMTRQEYDAWVLYAKDFSAVGQVQNKTLAHRAIMYDAAGGFHHAVPPPYVFPIPWSEDYLTNAIGQTVDAINSSIKTMKELSCQELERVAGQIKTAFWQHFKTLPLILPYAISPVTIARYLTSSNTEQIADVISSIIEPYYQRHTRKLCTKAFGGWSAALTSYTPKALSLCYNIAFLGLAAKAYDEHLNTQWIAYCNEHEDDLLTLLLERKAQNNGTNLQARSDDQEQITHATLTAFVQQAHRQSKLVLPDILKARNIWNKTRIKYCIPPLIAMLAIKYIPFGTIKTLATMYIRSNFGI